MRSCILIIIIAFAGCTQPKNPDIFIKKIDREGKLISTSSGDTAFFFSDDFWSYIIRQFESGSVELFYVGGISYPGDMVQDTSYCFSIINRMNRQKLISYFPKDLTESEYNSYVEDQTMQLPVNDRDFSLEVNKPAWKHAPSSIAEQYETFYKLLADTSSDHVLLMKRGTYREIINKLEHHSLIFPRDSIQF